MSKREFPKGNKVSWKSHGGTAEGTIEEKITSDTTVAKRTVRASRDEAQYRVRSDKSGNDAVHQPRRATSGVRLIMADDKDTTWTEFHDAVTMTAWELESWLNTEESRRAGQKSGGDESTGHASGRRIMKILKSKKAELSDDDYAYMRNDHQAM